VSHQKLDAAAILATAEGWQASADGKAITRLFQFGDFNAAFAFMTRCALRAEQLDHHPEWSNVYNKVNVRLTTHDVDGLSDRDLAMAQFMDKVAHTQNSDA